MPKTKEGEIVIVNVSGRGDKDLNTIISSLNL
jgi:tryptophan synthase beta subunit